MSPLSPVTEQTKKFFEDNGYTYKPDQQGYAKFIRGGEEEIRIAGNSVWYSFFTPPDDDHGGYWVDHSKHYIQTYMWSPEQWAKYFEAIKG